LKSRPIEGPGSSRPNVGQLAGGLEPDNTLHRGGAHAGTVRRIGGRITIVYPDGPCLDC
jgi:hypothetical protein